MPVARARAMSEGVMAGPRHRVARVLVLLLVVIGLAVLSATPATAADFDTRDMVDAFEAQGMDCQSNDAMVLCSLNQECELQPDGYSCTYDAGLEVMTATIQRSAEEGDVRPFVEVNASQEPATGEGLWSSGVFLAAVDVACPEVREEVQDWLQQLESGLSFNGDVDETGSRCVVSTSHSDFGDNEAFSLFFGSSFTPIFSLAPLPSASAPGAGTSADASASAPASPAPSSTPVAGEGPVPGGPAASPPDGAAVGPGAFLTSIPAAHEVSVDPAILVQSALLAMAVVFLMPFPAQLFNSTVESNGAEIRGWFAPLTRPLRGLGGSLDAFWRTPLGIGAFLALSAVLYALLDPAIDVSVEALQTLLALAAGIAVVTLLFAVPLLLAHRRLGDRPVVEALPGTLLVGAACVAVSRLADFQPGYLYGLVIGFAFAQELDPRAEGRNGALAALLMLVAATAAWLGLGLLDDAAGFVPNLVRTVLAAIMVAGLEGVVFGLMPLRFLPGEPIYRWNRVAWGALLLIGLFAFFHILINPSSGYLADSSRTPLLTIVALLVGFGALSVGLWAYFRYRPPRTPADLPLAEADPSD